MGKERPALQEEQRKGRQADTRHAVGHLAAPLVRKGRTGRANAVQKGLKHLHAGLNHTSSQSETHSSHHPFSTTWAERIWVSGNSNRIRNAVPPRSQAIS